MKPMILWKIQKRKNQKKEKNNTQKPQTNLSLRFFFLHFVKKKNKFVTHYKNTFLCNLLSLPTITLYCFL